MQNFHFLVVEDNAAMLRMLISMLQNLGYTKYQPANNGAEAWDIIKNSQIDIVLSDYFMPKVDGLELLAKIRSSVRFWSLPFIMITSESRKNQVIHSTEEDIDAYIVKPVTTEKLSKYVTEVLKNRYEPDSYHQALLEGRRNLRDGKLEGARDNFTEAAVLNPNGSTPYYYLGEILERLGDDYEAEESYLKCNDASHSLYVRAFDGLARIYTRRKDFPLATKVLRKAVEVSPNNIKRSLQLGRLYSKTGNQDEAYNAFYKAAEIANGDVEATEKIASECFNCGIENGAETILRKVYLEEIKEIKILNQFGLMCREKKEYDRAKDFYQKGLRKSPTSEFLNYNCAVLHIELKEYDIAKSYLERVLKHHPEFDKARILLEKLNPHLAPSPQ